MCFYLEKYGKCKFGSFCEYGPRETNKINVEKKCHPIGFNLWYMYWEMALDKHNFAFGPTLVFITEMW